MFDYSRTVVQVPGIIDSILSKKGGGGDALDMFPLAGALHRTQSLLRVAHNQPFFIGVAAYNFDDPGAFDTAEMVRCLTDLKAMKPVDVPIYDFVHHCRSEKRRRVEPADVVIVEGILVLHMPEIRDLLNMKIYVDTDDDVRLARRIQRDVSVRGRDVSGVIQQYTSFVKPSFDAFVAPSRKHADVILPWARDENVVAIDLITEHIRMKLQQPDLRRIYHNLEVIPSNFQIRGMHTIIRDRDTKTADFVFYADRLLRLVVEAGLGHLPFSEKCVTTPTGATYVGVDFAKKLCGVSIIRSGESMENALRACCNGVKIGKILVHRHPSQRRQPSSARLYNVVANSATMNGAHPSTDATTPLANGGAAANGHVSGANGHSEAAARQNGQMNGSRNASMVAGNACGFAEELIYEKLPQDIAERHVLLMDPILGAGTSAVRAIEVLLSKGVEEGKILFLTLIAAPEGIHNICQRFPRLKLITSEIDQCVDESMQQVVPGVGEFGNRYFCD